MNQVHNNYGIWVIWLGIIIYILLIFYYISKLLSLYLRKARRFPKTIHDIKVIFTESEKKEIEQTMKKFRRVGTIGMIVFFFLAILISALNTEWKL